MKRLKTWLLQWLGAVSQSEHDSVLSEMNRRYVETSNALCEHKSEHDAQIASLIEELNTVRNSIPTVAAIQPKPPVRVVRNWRDVKAAIEVRVPERKSS